METVLDNKHFEGDDILVVRFGDEEHSMKRKDLEVYLHELEDDFDKKIDNLDKETRDLLEKFESKVYFFCNNHKNIFIVDRIIRNFVGENYCYNTVGERLVNLLVGKEEINISDENIYYTTRKCKLFIVSSHDYQQLIKNKSFVETVRNILKEKNITAIFFFDDNGKLEKELNNFTIFEKKDNNAQFFVFLIVLLLIFFILFLLFKNLK